MGHCKICCANEMIVGRWYKIVTYPVDEPDVAEGYPAACAYWAKYSCTDSNVFLAHDTVFVKSTGEFTISVVDMYGNTDSKTIRAVEAPVVERTPVTITPTGWDDLRAKIDGAGAYKYITIPKGAYVFNVTAELYNLPEGTVLDFSGSTVTVNCYDTSFHMFGFTTAHNGICNANFVGGNVGPGSDIAQGSEVVEIRAGAHHFVENLTFRDVTGYIISLGMWCNHWASKPNATASQWKAENNTEGYIADDGNVVARSGAWTMAEMVPTITTPDRAYGVGQVASWIPTGARTYDIAFYDADRNLIEISRDQQYFRRYYYPENAVYVRYGVYQTAAPTNLSGADDYCVMRMLGPSNLTEHYPTVLECCIDNVKFHNHASGGFSGTGLCEDVHITRLYADGNGWINPWAFDIEDSWNAALGYVVSHSYFGYGTAYLHGAQGATLLSCILGAAQLVNNVHFPTLINCVALGAYAGAVRGNATAINSYWGTPTMSSEPLEHVYAFGALDAQEATEMRTRIAHALANFNGK